LASRAFILRTLGLPLSCVALERLRGAIRFGGTAMGETALGAPVLEM